MALVPIHFDPGTGVIGDRGYNDCRLFAKWTKAGMFFVTRIKSRRLLPVSAILDSGDATHAIHLQP